MDPDGIRTLLWRNPGGHHGERDAVVLVTTILIIYVTGMQPQAGSSNMQSSAVDSDGQPLYASDACLLTYA